MTDDINPIKHRMVIALNGPVLDDRKGAFAGICIVDYKEDDTWDEPVVNFFEGAAGGHATQINTTKNIGILGGFANSVVTYDPADGEEIRFNGDRRYNPLHNRRAMAAAYHGPTHAIFLSETEFIQPLDNQFVKRDLNRPDWYENLGPHRVPWPHAMKLSASGRFIFYGAMDYPDGKAARMMGVFDLLSPNVEWRASIIHTPKTVWHVAVHPTKDIGYAVTQCYIPGVGRGLNQHDEFAVAIEYGFNYAFKVDFQVAISQPKNAITDHMAFAAGYPNHLSSDIAVLDDDRIIANFCASGRNGVIDFKNYSAEYIDERVVRGWRKKYGYSRWFGKNKKPNAELIRSFLQTLADAGSIINLPTNTHLLLQALRATDGSKADGPFGLSVNKSKTRFFSAHRGLNAILVYDMTKLWPWPLIRTINLPKAAEFLPKHLNISKHLGLGMHHMTAL